jgi:hypothetical protein
MEVGFEAYSFVHRSGVMTLLVAHILQLELICLVSPLNLLSLSFIDCIELSCPSQIASQCQLVGSTQDILS